MLIWLKRWLAYLLVSSGLVLLFIPLCTYRLEYVEKDFLFLENSEDLFIHEKAAQAKPPLPKPESPEEEWQRMNERREQRAIAEARADEIVNPYGYPKIQKEDLASCPSLYGKIDTLQRVWSACIGLTRLDTVSLEEWENFRKTFGVSDENGAFQCGRYIFKGHIKADSVSVPVEVKNLRAGCKTAAVVFLIIGLAALGRCYISHVSDGIRIGRRSAIIIWDVIIILFSIPFVWWFIEFGLAKFFQTATEWDEDFAIGMGVFWVALAHPVLALITTATSLQTLLITKDSITVKGLFGKAAVPWSAVEGFRVSQAYSPRKVGSVPAPHRVMKIMEIRSGKSTLRVLEPPYASTKKEIINLLTEYAPEEIKPSIAAMSKEWLSKLL